MKKPFRYRAISLGFVGACLISGGIGVGTYWSTHRLVRSFDSVSESHQAIEKLLAIQELVQSGESSAYNYVITGREERLTPFRQAKVQVPRKLREIEALVKDHPRLKSALRQFSRAFAVHQDYLSKVVSARQESGFEAASQWVTTEDNHALRDVLRDLLNEAQKDEGKVLRKRWASTSEHSSEATWALIAAASVSFLLIVGMFGWVRRETDERYVAETANQQLETFLRSIVERTPYMVLVKEAQTLRLTLVNKAATEWLGRSEQDLLGSNDYDLRPKEAARIAMQQDRDVLQNGKPVDIPEEILIREGKEERILHTQKVAIPDAMGNPAFLLTISEDITQRKQAQRMLELSRDSAVQSERLKSEFIRNMSHEIRTPLSIVVGMTSILMDSNLTPEQRGFAGKVEHAAGGLAKLTRSILDFSKIEAGTFVLEMQEMNLRQSIEGILGMMNEQAKTKGVGLVSLVPPNIPQTLVGDPIRLRQVMTELIGNALKFTERGEIIVRVSEAEQNDQQFWATIKITDTGVGITEEAQKHLFEPFRQGDGSATRRYGGTGLGLAISKRIVELMGGTIGFSSAPREGSTFWCTIPFKKRGTLGHVGNVATVPWAHARILVVDENEVTRQVLSDQFKAWSLATESVASGETALHLLRSEQKAGRAFRIVVLDMHLSDMDGVIFARAIRADASLAETQLVVLTDDPIDPSTVSSLGFAAAIQKPPVVETLYARLSSLIETPMKQNRSAA